MSDPVVVILAAGQGTRMRSQLPKLLHPICGRPMVCWPLSAAQRAFVDSPGDAAAGHVQIVVVDTPERRLAEVISGSAELAVQQQARGTADAVRAASKWIAPDSTVVVLSGDVPLISSQTIAALGQAHEQSGAAATIATFVLEDPSGYGRVLRGPDGTVERVVETKAIGDASQLELCIREVNAGIYAFQGGPLLEALEQVGSDNAQGEQYLPDVLGILRAQERTVIAHEVSDPDELRGVNDRAALAEVAAVARERINRRHMLRGVSIIAPQMTVIDAEVQIGEDSVIAPFTALHGSTVIGRGSTVGPGATVIDSRIGDGATVLHSYLREADVGDRASVGPFAYLRPGARLRQGAKAGTFVEIKNSDIGAGSKVPHLSYIGDADVGEGSNLGASTVTANYDGKSKHRTTIGDAVSGGVDVTLVAPVTLGDGSYTAAGSVIDTDVPPGALGVARSRQTNVEGYAERRKGREEQGEAGDRGKESSEPPTP